MPNSSVSDALIAFAQAVRLDRRANPTIFGDGTGLELLLAPKFQALVETLLSQRFPIPPRVLPEYRKQAIGRPDLALAREGEPARAFIELKQPETSLVPGRLRGHDAAQFKRFCDLPLWGFCNFHTIHLFQRAELREQAIILPAAALDPATADALAERLIRRSDPAPFIAILETLALASPIVPRNAQEIAETLAHAARLAQHIVLDQCRIGLPPVLAEVRAEFRETLFAHPAAGGYDTSDEDALFANAFAQTLAFGLLLAREAAALKAAEDQHPVPAIDRDAYRALPTGSYPLLRATLRALTQDEILDILGVGFDVLLDTVNAVDTDLLKPAKDTDPILYFYEDFLAVFDPDAKKRHGVFFTPVPVVRFMVAATDRALRDGLGTQGLLDPDVLLLDPACGTGTFLIAAASRVASEVRATMGEGAVAQEVAALARRLHGFELLVGPYTVAHYRLLREVGPHDPAAVGRLPIYLADTLAPPAAAIGITSRLGFMAAPIVAERQAADALKRDTPIIAIFGNPPYRRLGEGEEAAIVSGWDGGFWDDLKDPVRRAGWGGELNTFPDLYVAFWRWCLWKLFESEGAPKRGVVCLITNRTFLAGHPYAGLRLMLRRRFDTIDIVDLRGDSRGARPSGIEVDENVFAIQAGVCVLIGQATANGDRPSGAEAKVRYADVWRHAAFSARDKLALLTAAEQDESVLTFVDIERQGLDDFVPPAFGGLDWPSLVELFPFRKSGSKSQRDPLVYGLSRQAVVQKISAFLSADDADARAMFFPAADADDTPTRAEQLRLARARREEMDRTKVAAKVADYAYRPLDRRYQYVSPNFVSRYGRDLLPAWGTSNVALYALPSGTGAGPAVWVHGLIPDYHAFRGSYGGYAFPLFNRAMGPQAHNLHLDLLSHLSEASGGPVGPQQAFDAIAALLSATSYTSRFAWDLEEAFPHVPFPSSGAVFARAAAIDAEIRSLETFARAPAAGFRSARLTGRATGTTLGVPSGNKAWEDGAVLLRPDGSLRLSGVPERVWRFAVSGYRLLPRWLDARNGENLDADLQRAILDIAWRIEELLHWFDAADPVLALAIASLLTCQELGLGPTPSTPLE